MGRLDDVNLNEKLSRREGDARLVHAQAPAHGAAAAREQRHHFLWRFTPSLPGLGRKRRTDHEGAPWHVIAAESKPPGRVAVLGTVIEALEAGLRATGHDPVKIQAKL